MAMALAVAGLVSSGEAITDVCIDKSFRGLLMDAVHRGEYAIAKICE